MGEENGIGIDVEKLNNVLLTDDSTPACVGDFSSGEDLPVIVGVVVGVASDLLTCIQGQGESCELSLAAVLCTTAYRKTLDSLLLLILPSSYRKGYLSGCECKNTFVSLCLIEIVS